MPKIQSQIPIRQRNWKKYQYLRNKQNNISYQCECGKTYAGYSAIQLHFIRKHGMKIHNLKEKKQFQELRNNQKHVFLFFTCYKHLRFANDYERLFTEEIEKILVSFQEEYKQYFFNNNIHVFAAKLLRNFLYFLLQNEMENYFFNSESYYQFLNDMPTKFNRFFQSEWCNLQNNDEYLNFCSLFLQLSQWLNQKNFSYVQLQILEEVSALYEQKFVQN